MKYIKTFEGLFDFFKRKKKEPVLEKEKLYNKFNDVFDYHKFITGRFEKN